MLDKTAKQQNIEEEKESIETRRGCYLLLTKTDGLNRWGRRSDAEKGEDDWDPLYLVRPLNDGLRERLRKMKKPGRYVAVDESIISCKLRTFLLCLLRRDICFCSPSRSARVPSGDCIFR